MTVLLAGLGWAALSMWLYGMGVEPSGPSLFGPEHHRYQAFFVLPLLMAATALGGRVAVWGAARLGGGLSPAQGSEVVGLGLGAGAGMGLVAPELMALSRGGVDALRALAPWSAVAGVVLLVSVQAILASNLGRLGASRALVLSLGLLAFEGLLLAPFLR